jgi:hypothetical protein
LVICSGAFVSRIPESLTEVMIRYRLPGTAYLL